MRVVVHNEVTQSQDEVQAVALQDLVNKYNLDFEVSTFRKGDAVFYTVLLKGLTDTLNPYSSAVVGDGLTLSGALEALTSNLYCKRILAAHFRTDEGEACEIFTGPLLMISHQLYLELQSVVDCTPLRTSRVYVLPDTYEEK